MQHLDEIWNPDLLAVISVLALLQFDQYFLQPENQV